MHDFEARPEIGMLGHLDLDRKRVFELGEMRDYEHFVEVLADPVDGFPEVLEAAAVLGSEALIDDEGSQTGAGAAGQDLGQRDAQGEVGTEGLATRVQLIRALSELVGDLDVERLFRAAALEIPQ